MEKKLDLKKELPELYRPPGKSPAIVEVPLLKYLMIDGVGAGPGNEVFQNAIQALFSVSYKAKFISKKELGSDYVVMPLEGLWWADDMNDFVSGRKERWCWTLMLLQPEFISCEIIERAIEDSEGKAPPASLGKLRFDDLNEGMSAQIMHIGPYSEEH